MRLQSIKSYWRTLNALNAATGLPGRGKPSRPAFPRSKAGLGPFKAGTVFNQSINQNGRQMCTFQCRVLRSEAEG